MNRLQAGFARVDITPELGVSINGYYIPRKAKKILDALETNCLALGCGESKVVLLSLDNLGIAQKLLLPIRQVISKATGLPLAAIYVHATHSHTAGAIASMLENKEDMEYRDAVTAKMVEAVQLALADLQPARMGWGVSQAPNVAFVRRFRMRDGSVCTNPGTNHPDIVAPIGDVDERVNVLRFDRESDSLVLMNFGNHPDTVGGCNISADWPGFARRSLEQAIPGTKAIMFNGAQGDVNHINVHPTGGAGNDLVRDFDDVDRGYGHARHIGRVIAGAVLQVYDKVCYTDVEQLRYLQKIIDIPSNIPDEADLPLARKYAQLHNDGKDAEIPYTGMMLTTVVAEALRMLRLENGPETFQLPLSGIAIGNVAMIGIAGEPFTGIGRALKEAPGWELVLPTCATNGYEGYFPMMDAYDEGGYEARSSNFKAGIAELLISEGQKLLKELQLLQNDTHRGKTL